METIARDIVSVCSGWLLLESLPGSSNSKSFFSWGSPRAIFARLPRVSLVQSFEWLDLVMAGTLSAKDGPPLAQRQENSLSSLKRSLGIMFQKFIDQEQPQKERHTETFHLVVDRHYDTMVICSNPYYDGNIGLIAIDAFLIPLVTSQALSPAARLYSLSKVIDVSVGEERLWKHMMLALVKRCREGWHELK